MVIKFDFCFTSPPYSNQRDYSGNIELKPDHIAKFISSSSNKCDLYAINLGLSRKDGEIIPYWNFYIEDAKKSELKLLSWNVWDKDESGSIGNQSAMFAITHEFIFIFGRKRKDLNKTYPNKSAGANANHTSNRQKDGTLKKSKKTIISNFSQIRTVTRVSPQKARDEINHPARFPVELPEIYIEACTLINQIIYDPFGGSGTTLIACEKLKRKCYMMELSPEYCDVIVKRYENYTGKKAVREAMDGQTKIGKNSSTCSHR